MGAFGVDWLSLGGGIEVTSWKLESIDNSPQMAYGTYYPMGLVADFSNPEDTMEVNENTFLSGLQSGRIRHVGLGYLTDSKYVTGNANLDYWQRRVARITYRDSTKTREDLSGRLFFAKKEPVIFFFPDFGLVAEARLQNQLREKQKALEAARMEVSNKLDNLGEIRSHLFDDYLYCFAAEYQMDYSPGYPSDAFTTPTTTFSFFLANKKEVSVSELTQWGRSSVADSNMLLGIELVDSVKVEDYFLDGVRIDGFGFPDEIYATEDAALKLEYNKLYNEFKPIYLEKQTWFMIPEDRWKASAEIVKDRCTGVFLPPTSLTIPQKEAIEGGAIVYRDIPGSLKFFDTGTVEPAGGGTYNYYGKNIDPVIDPRPIFYVGYEPKYGTFEMEATSGSVKMVNGSPIKCSPGAILTYVTITGNVFIATALRDATYEMEAERLRKEEEDIKRRNEEFLAEMAQKHGQKYVDAFNRLDIIVGMPEKLAALLMNEYYFIKNTSSSSSGTLYQCESRFESNAGLWITISSGKVTYISTY